MSTLLKLKKINLKYQTGKEVIKVLQNINFETKTKETISIVGESGSGKTSLIMLIAGLEKVTSGKIFFQDQEITKLNEDMVVIKVSELLKDSDAGRKILDHDIVSTIEAAVQELVGAGKLVEIIQEENHE